MSEQKTFNLVDEPWIPVLMRNGKNRLVSLGEVFADETGDISDLAINPYERVAVFRLLLCIAQASFAPNGLENERAWFDAKRTLSPKATDYLIKWHERFFLYGPNAFMQVDCLKPGGTIPYTSRLLLQSAHHFGSPLFSRDVDTTGKIPLPSQSLAVALLAYQNFSASGGTPTCKWKGTATNQVGAAAAPCRGQSKLFTILLGDSLLDSLWMNLLTNSQLRSLRMDLGRPCWEFSFDRCETIENESAGWLGPINTSSRTANNPSWLGTLAPLSRFIKLKNGSAECLVCEGFKYPQAPLWREPDSSFYYAQDRNGGAQEIRCIRVNPRREPWRDLASILELGTGRGGAIALEHLTTLSLRHPSIKSFSIWTGGMASNADRDQDMTVGEWKFSRSIGALRQDALSSYQEAIGQADHQRTALYRACRQYALVAKTPDPTANINKQKENELVSAFSIPAERIYWDLLARPEKQRILQDMDPITSKDDWKKAVFEAAEEAYKRACPAMTARQIDAFAQGFSKLTIREERTNE